MRTRPDNRTRPWGLQAVSDAANVYRVSPRRLLAEQVRAQRAAGMSRAARRIFLLLAQAEARRCERMVAALEADRGV